MASKSERSEKVRDGVRETIEQDHLAEIDRIESRECSSDRFNGVQIDIYGEFVPIKPIISFAKANDEIGIEHFFHCTDEEEPYVGVFFAYLTEQPHPAFV